MRIFLFILLSVVLGTAAPVWGQDEAQDDAADWDNSTPTTNGTILAFVGKKVSIEKNNLTLTEEIELPDGTMATRIVPRLSDRFEARYEILETIKGSYEEPYIDFVNHDHYGRPTFPKFETVLLFLMNNGGEWVNTSRTFFPVQRTTDGDWAKCGSLVRDDYNEDLKKYAASFEENILVEPIKFLGSETTLSPEYCTTGTRASNLYKFTEHTRFAPERRRISCNRELGIRDGFNAGTGPLPGAKIEGIKHAACIERLEAEDELASP